MTNKDQLILLTGGAGLVGQNLLITLVELGYTNIAVVDKHAYNLDIIARLHPAVRRLCEDLSEPGEWQQLVQQAGTVIMLQAQIGNTDSALFHRNNIQSTERILAAAQLNKPYLVHISSSVVNSRADDDYVRSKSQQEQLVRNSQLDWTILRPTLMFGHFDRKHLGWLSRFMAKSPVFPIPGHGKYLRQPLYAGDFCRIIASCIANKPLSQTYNISGLQPIDYIDMIKAIRKECRANSLLLPIPYGLFYALLKIYAVFDEDPPFTTRQLEALVIDEVFEVIDWEHIFGLTATPFPIACKQTFSPSKYSDYILEF